LGGGEVKMTEMAQAYSIFANLGKKVDIDPILEIDNYLGENIFSKEVKKSEVVEAKYAFLINRVLWDDSARSAIFGLNSRLKIPGKTVAVKTGTTPTYLVAAWVGNNNNSPMSWVASGISGATPIWNRIMSQMLLDKPDQMWEVPDGVYKAVVCNKEEYFTDGREKEVECPSRLESVASKENRPGAE
jgi:membrane carboxypeptidase/penicillin-binding protein